jgi:hypothetical protein
MFEEFLNDIVAENILHQLYRVGQNLFEQLLLLVAVSCLQFLLDETRAMLIPTKFNDVTVDILHPHVSGF